MDDKIKELVDKQLPPDEELQELAEFFKVFGDATRLKILNVLIVSEMCVQDIAYSIGMSESAVSHQLRVLKQMDLVKNRRDGKTIFYALADTHILTILNTGIEHLEEED
ncbi:MAG: metalloregulator ArsR/SmtB family transcription factor [Lachnospiraceae bacterium]|nr:metalloregulator ArsR/SmtB family transcription factor [Lachnospiraceae bacterium]